MPLPAEMTTDPGKGSAALWRSLYTLLEVFSRRMDDVVQKHTAAKRARGKVAIAKVGQKDVAANAPVPEQSGASGVSEAERCWTVGDLDLTAEELKQLVRYWPFVARPEQMPPEGGWRSWLLMGGRGSGKTRAGAEWVHGLAGRHAGLRVALDAETLADAREVMIDGVSGIMRIARANRPAFEISRRRLVWPNGSVAQVFSSEDPESLRGPQFHYAWCDELGKWKHAEETFDMLQFGLRLGPDPRQLITTTPRPVPVLKRLIADPATMAVKVSTRANAANLAPGFVEALEALWRGQAGATGA